MNASLVHVGASLGDWLVHHAPRMADRLGRLAPDAPWRRWSERHARRRFAANLDQNLFLGVYDSFDDAVRDAPATRPVGYDNAASADLYTPTVYPYDYPAMFWLTRAFADGMRTVFDLGGHIGLKYFAFRRHMPFPDLLRWTVCDVPAVVARGRELAAARDVGPQLAFTTDLRAASGHDVLYASGSLQYLPMRLGELLGAMARRPRRIVLNITAVHPTRTYVTLNSIGTAVCPYRVQARDELVAEVTAFGYTRRDEWDNPGKQLDLPFAPSLRLDHYTGFCFDLD